MSNKTQRTISNYKRANRQPKYTVNHMVDDLKQLRERGIMDATASYEITPELPDASMYF